MHHKYLFSLTSLRALLEKKGFEVIDFRMELEYLTIVDNPNLLNCIKAFAKKLIKLIEFFNKGKKESIVVYAKKI